MTTWTVQQPCSFMSTIFSTCISRIFFEFSLKILLPKKYNSNRDWFSLIYTSLLFRFVNFFCCLYWEKKPILINLTMRELFLIILVLLFSFGSFVLLWRHKSYNAFFQFMKWNSFVGKIKARRRFSCNKLERETGLLTKYVRQKVFLQRDKCVCPCT